MYLFFANIFDHSWLNLQMRNWQIQRADYTPTCSLAKNSHFPRVYSEMSLVLRWSVFLYCNSPESNLFLQPQLLSSSEDFFFFFFSFWQNKEPGEGRCHSSNRLCSSSAVDGRDLVSWSPDWPGQCFPTLPAAKQSSCPQELLIPSQPLS